MAKDVWIGKKDFKYLYYRYKDSEYVAIGLIGLAIVTSLALIFLIIIPQFNDWFSIREEVIATRARIEVLQNNINFMNSLDKGAVNKQLQVASDALPPEKDFASMLNVLSSSAVSTGVGLNDFSFRVGSLATSSAIAENVPPQQREKGISLINITVIVQGNADAIRKFISEIEKSLPISEVAKIDGTGQTMSVSMDFYQKNYPNVVINDNNQITPLSADKLSLLQKLETWKKAVPATQSTGSASTVPVF